jgi:hypothetical protein
VSSPEKAEIVRRMGAELVIDRSAEDYRFWKDEHEQDPKEWQRFGKRIRELTGGDDIDIVFEHPGRETFGASVYVTKKGGVITTCASTSGYMHTYDNRYLWMNLKRIVGSHFANYKESWEANRLISRGSSTRRCRGRTRSSRPARRPTTCTRTCTRARSACCAWRRRRGSASSRRPGVPGPSPRRDQPLPGRLSTRPARPCGGARPRPARVVSQAHEHEQHDPRRPRPDGRQ